MRITLPSSAFRTSALLALAWAAFQPLAGHAQQPCTAIQNDAERLACYDRALRGTPPPAPAPRAVAPAAPAAAATAPATAPITTEDRGSRRERRAREAEVAASAPVARTAPAAPAAVDPVAPAPTRSTATASAAPAEQSDDAARGRRGARQDAAKPGSTSIVVVQVRALPGRAATFVTDKGDTWVQTDTYRNPFPQTPFKASIQPGAMSSFFLIPDEQGHAVRVRHGG